MPCSGARAFGDTKVPAAEESEELVEGRDYVVDQSGRYIFTREYLLRRGYCCENGCRNCPYGFRKAE